MNKLLFEKMCHFYAGYPCDLELPARLWKISAFFLSALTSLS